MLTQIIALKVVINNKSMSVIKTNIFANYVGQFYIVIVAIAILPLYLKALGGEAYGLVGFFSLLQSWMLLFDLGMSATLGREVARLKGTEDGGGQLRTVLRSLETIFLGIGLLSALTVYFGRNWIAENWLSVKELDIQLVANCIGLMALMIGIRWLSALHRSGINAYEKHVWINCLDIILATLRFPGALLLIKIFDGDILIFFWYQASIAAIEQVFITRKLYKLLPQVKLSVPIFSSLELKRIAPFSFGVAYTACIWVFVSQLDKLLLSKYLTLVEYGYFTLVTTVASGLLMVSGPINKAILPRMTALFSQNNEKEMLNIYRKSSRFVIAIVTPLVVVLSLFPKEVIYIWTGDNIASSWAEPVLPLFIIGSGLLVVNGMQYSLQYVHGKLRSHVVYNTISGVVSIPFVIYFALNYGPIGAGWVWLIFRLVTFSAWVPYIHHKFAPRLHKKWLINDVLLPIFSSVALQMAFVYCYGNDVPNDRLHGLIFISVVSAVGLVGAGLNFLRKTGE